MAREDHLKRGSTTSTSDALVAGMFSGAISRSIVAPLDTVKIRLQLLTKTYGTRVGAIDTALGIVRNEGLRALWKGNVPAELMYIIYGATQFGSYATMNRTLSDLQQTFPKFHLSDSVHSLFVGAGSGLTSTIVTYPFDLLRTRLAANTEKKFLPMLATAKNIYNTAGFKGFFLGLGPASISLTTYTALMFWTYEISREIAAKNDHIPLVEGICGFVAGTIAKGITFPLDTIRKRLQMLRANSAMQLCKTILLKEGLLGFYKGFGISVLKTAPTSALTMYFYEFSLAWMNREPKL